VLGVQKCENAWGVLFPSLASSDLATVGVGGGESGASQYLDLFVASLKLSFALSDRPVGVGEASTVLLYGQYMMVLGDF